MKYSNELIASTIRFAEMYEAETGEKNALENISSVLQEDLAESITMALLKGSVCSYPILAYCESKVSDRNQGTIILAIKAIRRVCNTSLKETKFACDVARSGKESTIPANIRFLEIDELNKDLSGTGYYVR